ncbi:hypothetical protein [Virgibacillus halodenitrificans]|uniref:hypothetical protein n=1 Tax=Virgibacillus halodenitrificans TaxID=1482 RepID=UPI00037B62A9|nr:hypothetical protein [Virgibacillus halodenitrificans]
MVVHKHTYLVSPIFATIAPIPLRTKYNREEINYSIICLLLNSFKQYLNALTLRRDEEELISGSNRSKSVYMGKEALKEAQLLEKDEAGEL